MTAQDYAKILRVAYEKRIPCSPLREQIGVNDVELAYQIQAINNQILIQNGASITGHKIGLTSKAVQEQLGVDQPDFGMLLDTMEVLNGGTIQMSELMQPKVEAEIAFVLGKDLPNRPVSTVELINAIDYALAAIEIVGSRIKDWNIKITDTIADNASASHYVLGHKPTKLSDFDVINCQMSMTKNGSLASEGKGAACLGSPINATLWLADKMAEIGTPLKAGQVILSGALGKMTTVQAGDTIEASIDGLSSVSVSFI